MRKEIEVSLSEDSPGNFSFGIGRAGGMRVDINEGTSSDIKFSLRWLGEHILEASSKLGVEPAEIRERLTEGQTVTWTSSFLESEPHR